MKLSLLITGQIRDPSQFRSIAEGVVATTNHFDKIIFSSWSDQIALAKAVWASLGDEGCVTYCDCGQALPIEPVINRDIKSFIAQHQQLALGLANIEESSVVRMRADAKIISSEHFSEIIDLIEVCWNYDNNSEKSLVLGASLNIPFFFDDRMLIMSPNAAESVKNVSLSYLYGLDYHNLFPEYLIYSNMLRNDTSGAFLKHDHRFRFRAPKASGGFVDYDFAAFGPTYPSEALNYLSAFQSKFAFLREIAAKIGRADVFDRLFPGIAFDCLDFTSLRERWTSFSNDYVVQFANWMQSVPGTNHEGNIPVESAKQTLNFAYTEYSNRRYDNVIRLSRICKNTYFMEDFLELEGCSQYLLGNIEQAKAILTASFASGHRGFEQMFYLIAIFVAARDLDSLNAVSKEFLDLYPDDDRPVRHVIGAYSSLGFDLVSGDSQNADGSSSAVRLALDAFGANNGGKVGQIVAALKAAGKLIRL